MKKETVIANLRAEISISDEMLQYFSHFESNSNAWFAREGGDLFLREFGHEWNTNFVEVAQHFFNHHFAKLGLHDE